MIFVQAGEKKLLVKGLVVRAWVAATVVVHLAASGGAPVLALPHGRVLSAPGISVVGEGSSERWIVDLGGVLVAALAPELPGGNEGLLLLVRPARKPDAPRRLLRLRVAPEPRLDLLAEGLSGWIDSLAAVDPGADEGLQLVAGGDGRIVSLGSFAALDSRVADAADGARLLVERALVEAEGLDLAAFAPAPLRRGVDRRFAALEAGRLRLWQAAGPSPDAPAGASPGVSSSAAADRWTRWTRWTVEREAALPLSVKRTAAGLRLASPPVAAVQSASGDLFLAGPEAVGSSRLRCYRIDAGRADSPPEELWAALPGPETVTQSWAFEIDGVPVLVVRTQAADELNLFERQRLRVLPLSADRTRSGAPPTLAVELDSKRWHETAVALGDVDGDGRDDLLAAFPEGLSGTDLVVQWWRGSGAGQFEKRPHRSDLQKAPPGWQLVAMPQPGLFLVGNDRMELRPFSSAGRGAVAERAALAASIPALAAVPGKAASKEARKVTVTVGGDGESSKVTNVEPDAEPLGAVELDSLPGAELLAVQGSGNGNERLILLRRRPDQVP
jgi:hypothetical protein